MFIHLSRFKKQGMCIGYANGATKQNTIFPWWDGDGDYDVFSLQLTITAFTHTII